MKKILQNIIKISIDIPYEDFTVYPTINITKEAIAKYCIEKNINYEFLEDNEDDTMQIKLDGKSYEILRYNGGRGGYGIKCRPI